MDGTWVLGASGPAPESSRLLQSTVARASIITARRQQQSTSTSSSAPNTHTHTWAINQPSNSRPSAPSIHTYVIIRSARAHKQARATRRSTLPPLSAHTFPLVRQCHATQPPTGWWLPFPVRPGTRPGNLSERPVPIIEVPKLPDDHHTLARFCPPVAEPQQGEWPPGVRLPRHWLPLSSRFHRPLLACGFQLEQRTLLARDTTRHDPSHFDIVIRSVPVALPRLAHRRRNPLGGLPDHPPPTTFAVPRYSSHTRFDPTASRSPTEAVAGDPPEPSLWPPPPPAHWRHRHLNLAASPTSLSRYMTGLLLASSRRRCQCARPSTSARRAELCPCRDDDTDDDRA
ncbi:hypothetical protein Purlil1_9976 [Purpureocillium lilacinum]|uniref:Uncharacterized protein n=1 Tax=Purpureocillium lilacinum TaxID=33203 RepID=A0ABR0BNN3_PURLI|nr:hypothetical protein Purlil1_9976 [Purpureocillium lilacinum]